jgi:hypothetical protein
VIISSKLPEAGVGGRSLESIDFLSLGLTWNLQGRFLTLVEPQIDVLEPNSYLHMLASQGAIESQKLMHGDPLLFGLT